MQELDSVREVDAFILEGAFWPDAEQWQPIFEQAESASRPRKLYPMIPRNPFKFDQPADWSPIHVPADPVKARGGSQWERSFLTVARVDSVEANEASQRLVDVRSWWWENVRGRLYQDPLQGLGIYVTDPPRSEVPYPTPEPFTAGLWVDAVQQHAWWEAARQVDKSRHTARQVDGWRQMREAAAAVYEPEIRQVLGVVNTHTTRLTAVGQLRRRAQAWA